MRTRHLLALGLLLVTACNIPVRGSASSSAPAASRDRDVPDFVPDLPLSHPPFDEVHASWKQRLDQPYVYIERRGSYAETGSYIATVHREMLAQGLEPGGPPFALFYDDPGTVLAENLRSRICIPVRGPRSPREPLHYDVLPSVTVAYAFATGPYPDVPRAYPGIFRFLERMNWVDNGPVREIYLVPPSSVDDLAELVTEVQIPATIGD